MTEDEIRRIAYDVCAYADANGIVRDKSEDEIVEDIKFVLEYECPEEVIYLYEYIDYDSEMWDEVTSIWRAINPCI